MGNIFNDDFRDFLYALNKHEVEYLLVGGYAVILHGYRRTTGDMDIWVNCTTDNYNRLVKAFAAFGMPVFGMTQEKFMDREANDVFSYGRPPVSIDIITRLKGVEFGDAFAMKQVFYEDGLPINFIHVTNLISAKKAAGRHKDLDDIEKLSGKAKGGPGEQ